MLKKLPPPASPSEPAPESIPDSELEGDYRPPVGTGTYLDPINARVEPGDYSYLLRLSEALNTTLDLRTLLNRTSELVRVVIQYRIFAILLVDERSQELRMRFQIGHTPEIERLRIPIGEGVVGQVAKTRQAILLNDVANAENYIAANEAVRSELAVPLINKNKLIGVLDIESEQAGYFRPEHLHLLTLTASRIAQSIQNARLYSRVTRQAQALEVLNEIAVELTSILDLDQLFERIGQLLRRLIDYQMFSIMLIDSTGQRLVTRYTWRFGHASTPSRWLPVETGIVGAAVREWRLINVPDVSEDPRYHMMNPETRSEMVVPLFYKNRVIGVLDLEHVRTGYFQERHERTLITLAAQIAIAIENARLYQQVVRHEQQLERDLSMARQVQLRLLPAACPIHVHGEFAAKFLPARAIGGDMYDFVEYDSNNSAIVLGDVSGKAAPAALFAALVSGIMRSAAVQKPAPAEMLRLLNDALQERRLDSQYVTMLYCVWNDDNQTLQVANAGAVPPIFCRGGEITTLKAEGFPLGMFPDTEYEEFSVATQPGDAFVFVSDGITDAENAQGEMYGTERLTSILCGHRELPAGAIADAIFADVARFQAGQPRFDDETILVLRVR
ncbi:GAF domain-containing SpoIIE family protein phosphatase [Acidicapsa ligni]|uniref:GAF domain-containing SpoIIE family protein phosphatase n=1 Tax=Acidicapsa ligni TaxID=542300 RepID=UPI0021E0BCC9|nr:GAF domain-containing SpoIIE family protein phosphatase [Acidicapsa ligni]